MCGITGIFDTRGARPIAHAALQRMNDAQHHRGPDEGSVFIEPGLGFGHRRLSIIDVATGQQPLHSTDRNVSIVFNGEIYNYQELMPELRALGFEFRTKSDTESTALRLSWMVTNPCALMTRSTWDRYSAALASSSCSTVTVVVT